MSEQRKEQIAAARAATHAICVQLQELRDALIGVFGKTTTWQRGSPVAAAHDALVCMHNCDVGLSGEQDTRELAPVPKLDVKALLAKINATGVASLTDAEREQIKKLQEAFGPKPNGNP